MKPGSEDDVALSPLPETATVAVIIPALNAGPTLDRAVASALEQEQVTEIAIAVGDDATAEEAERLADSDARVTVVVNDGGRTPDALNAAIAATTAPVIVRLDAHAELPPGYVRTALEALCETGAANVGGRQVPVGTATFQRAVGLAMVSRAGSGGAAYRSGGEAGPVDTVYLGVFRREALDAVNGFDPRFTRNQDAELNLRLRGAGFTVWFEPRLGVDYAPRSSLSTLARQYVEYGRWRRLTTRVHRSSVRLRQLAAPTVVLTMVLAGLLSLMLWTPAPILVAGVVYGTGIVLAATMAAKPLVLAPLVAVALAVMHLAWGIGFLLGPPRGIDGSNSRHPSPDR